MVSYSLSLSYYLLDYEGILRPWGIETESKRMQKLYKHAHLNMYRTMIINTITSREDRATITAIIGVSSEMERIKYVITIVCNGGLIQCFCRWQGMDSE